MERWVPLFDIFLNSQCPEIEASIWLQQSFDPSSNSHVSTSSFLSLLSTPSTAVLVSSANPCSSTQDKKGFMYMQTLPSMVQARILSFLAYENKRFCRRDLIKFARSVLREMEGLDFWVKKGAQQLIDVLSDSEYEWVFSLNLDSEETKVEDEFSTLPCWLEDAARNYNLVLPWLPVSSDELNIRMPSCSFGDDEDCVNAYGEEEEKEVQTDEKMEDVEVHNAKDVLQPGVEKMAECLRGRLLNFEGVKKTVDLANDIHQLCVESRVDALEVLTLIEPWKAADETSSVLINQFLDGTEDELGWPSHALCSFILPKLMALKDPAPRMLVSAIVEFCKVHQKAAEYALLLPLIFKKDGINSPICDIITRITKECLHQAHVSAIFQKLFSREVNMEKFICLPCHRCLISSELVCTESFFTWMQCVLNHNVQLTQDTVDQLVHEVCKGASFLSRSLKFGNFFLCLVSKCGPLLKSHKLVLVEAVEHTNTFLTKSILAKLTLL